jgi:hypothetical protein
MEKKTAKLILGNSLIIDHVKLLKEKFDKAIKGTDRLDLQSDMILEIDLTGIQLLDYILIQSGKLKKELIFSMKLEEDQRVLLTRSGFNYLTETMFS